MSEPKEIKILYQGLDWHIGVDGCYINTKERFKRTQIDSWF